ncbi:galanin receptor type 1-like [Ptychodera flava]|uniref:galanin receptor type 1-like n=1 Tax=Ptychodera flava TaxID=63121 RepID=UPI00396A7054
MAGLDYFSVPLKFTDVMQLLVGVLGFIGNAVICAVVPAVKMLRTTPNYFIATLAFADLLASVCTIVKIVVMRYPIPSGVVRALYCKFVLSDVFFWVTVTASVFLLVGITVERYFAVVYPFLYQKWFTTSVSAAIIALSWFLAFIFNVFAPITYNMVGNWCIMVWPSFAYMQFTGTAIFLLTYLLPMVFMIFAYVSMFKHVRVDILPANATPPQTSNPRRKLIQMLCIVASAFFICWTPNQWLFLFANNGAYVDFQSWYYEATVLIAVSNSCLNPFIYAFRSQKFRKAIRQLLLRVPSSSMHSETINQPRITRSQP